MPLKGPDGCEDELKWPDLEGGLVCGPCKVGQCVFGKHRLAVVSLGSCREHGHQVQDMLLILQHHW